MRRKRRRLAHRERTGLGGASSLLFAPFCEGLLDFSAGVSHVVEYETDSCFLTRCGRQDAAVIEPHHEQVSPTGVYPQLGDAALPALTRHPLRRGTPARPTSRLPAPYPPQVRGRQERRSRSPERTAHDSISSESALRSASTRSSPPAISAPFRSVISIPRPLFAAEAGIISDGHHRLGKSLTEALGNGIFTPPGAISSAGERCLHTAEVAGSSPASPTEKVLFCR